MSQANDTPTEVDVPRTTTLSDGTSFTVSHVGNLARHIFAGATLESLHQARDEYRSKMHTADCECIAEDLLRTSNLITLETCRRSSAELDQRDSEILSSRVQELDAIGGFRVGDFVTFSDGVVRRISYIWDDGPQTSDGGSFYLGNGHVSMSGGLYPHVPSDSLTPTGEIREGSVWFFRHDRHTAHNGVTVLVPFRVYACGLPANR